MKVKLSVNETKLTGLELGTGYYSTGFGFLICLWARTFTGLFEELPLGR